MAQNVSTAVMQRRVEAHDSLDDFPSPPWASRALIEHVIGAGAVRGLTALEPACNRGYMARPLAEYFGRVHARDIHDYGWSGQEAVEDFLWPGGGPVGGVDWVITNPPFRLAERFIARGLAVARTGVAVIVRTSFLEGVGRYENLYSPNPPSIVAQFCERVPMVKGRIDARASTATSYCWLVWIKGWPLHGTRFDWIPPCRKRLERAGDYEAPA